MSEDPAVLLVSVSPPYDRAIGRLAVESGLKLIRAGGHIGGVAEAARPILAVTQLSSDDLEGETRVRALQKQLGACPLVVLGERLGADAAVRLMRASVADVIELPAPSGDVAARALSWCRHDLPVREEHPIVGESASMRELREAIAEAAPVHTTVLLQGETGTGKGLVARTIHGLSHWASEPFVHVDCSALSPTIIESELFGHEKGAFTGAAGQRPGRFELAGRGTLFLDEIGDLDLPQQTKLLRVLQDRQYERVGGTQTLPMLARVVAATSRDLREEMAAGRFRRDLYYRLAVIPIRIPALRERRSDIPLLVRWAVPQVCQRLATAPPQISDSFYARMQAHSWPGNVRELLNVLERCLVQVRTERLEGEDLEGVIEEAVAGPSVPPLPAGPDERELHLLETEVGSDEERLLLETTILEAGGNISRVARRLRVRRSTLRYRIRRAGLSHLIPKD